MAQKVKDTGASQPNVTTVTGKASSVTPPKPPSGAGVGSVYASAAPDGFIGWNPGADVPLARDTVCGQPTNLATL